MKLLLLVCLLTYSSTGTAQTETLHVRQTEGNTAVLRCGRLTKGPVTWSRDTNGQRVDILTTHNGEMTKHIADPDRRYNSQADLVLIIRRVSQSDAGRYDCSGATVELSVTEGPSSFTTSTTTTEAAATTPAPTTPPTTTTAPTSERRATPETTRTTKASSGGTTQGSSSKEEPPLITAETAVLWKVLIIAVSCLVVVALALFSWRRFYKRKAHLVTRSGEFLLLY
ncbi:mucin-5AC-like isoform X2 [Pygocentrus nattereri]|uniref:mucin-5AC-like isoform X2 n=1 Tax=Pygocentrus nattereri TaxID=42514 RepID=UPI001891DA51|nr:mucin-5AC-like isoform X2 [Pygocentrus nattereri]